MPATLEELRDATDVVPSVIRVRRPYQDVGRAHERRVQRVAALVRVVVGKDRTVMLGDGANDRVIGQVGLDDDLAGAIAAAGAARNLLQQVVSALPALKSGSFNAKSALTTPTSVTSGKSRPLAIIWVPSSTAQSAASNCSRSFLCASLPRVESASIRIMATSSGSNWCSASSIC